MKPSYKISAGVLSILAGFLGTYEGIRYTSYKDVGGKPTICYGHTGPDIKLGQHADKQQCNDYLIEDTEEANKILVNNIPDSVYQEMTDRTKAAFISFIYNVGPGKPGVKSGFVWLKSGQHSTIYRKLQEHDVKGACEELGNWIHVGATAYKGLVSRRKGEIKLCLSE